VIPHPCRQKGGGPQLGASRPGERGPYGWYGADEDTEPDEDHLDDGQDEQTAQAEIAATSKITDSGRRPAPGQPTERT